MKNFISTLIILLLLGIAGGVSFAYSGIFNVATSWEDPGPVRWLLVTTRESSIKSHAKTISAPELGSREQIEDGYRGFRDMCVICHTLPGQKASPVAQGLNPEPPDLADEADHMSAAELFWVTKNGIRMTGMPAWGPTHDDQELWDVIAFIKAMPELSEADYRSLEQLSAQGHGHGAGAGHDSGAGIGHGDESHIDRTHVINTGEHSPPDLHTDSHQETHSH